MVFVLQPNIAGGLAIYTKTDDVIIPAQPLASPPVLQSVTLGTCNLKKVVTFDTANRYSAATTRAEYMARPDRFRLVSAALRLSCVNTAQFNGGWFEAVRVATDYQISAGQALTVLSEYDVSSGVPCPNDGWEGKVMSSDRWPNHPSYVTGKLSDLYKHQFYLQPQGD
jgi:hypothetical protein